MTVGDIIRQTAARYPDKVGLVYEDQQYSWQEVNSRVNRLAHGLLGLGLRKGDRVAILSRNCNPYLEFYFAA
ncbi:MAG: AMP-binding protein, partial [Acidobacteria bacterium]|nr:AMP-binding protein [Acidobacteriota bacterium]